MFTKTAAIALVAAGQAAATITETSLVGEVMTVSYDLTFTGGNYECIDTYSSGNVKNFQVNFDYTTSEAAATSVDFVAVLKYTSAETADCIQVGKFNFVGGNGERCTNYFDWPAEWTTNGGNGTYATTVDVSSAGYNWPAGDYTVCFGDGNTGSQVETFKGTASFPDILTENSPIAITSPYGEVLEATFDLAFKGGEYVCVRTYASGAVNTFDASITFTSTDFQQDSIDFAAVLKFDDAPAGNCIQVGKFNFFGGNGERCNHYFDWPEDWSANVTSGETYTAQIDVSSANYNFAAGYYEVCYGDGNLEDTYETFVGSVAYPGLTSQRDNVLVVASTPGEVLEVTYDLAFTGGEYVCVDTRASGTVKNFVADLTFNTTDATQDSVDFVAVIKYTSNGVADCIQVGKFQFLGGEGERCSHYFDWPEDWNANVSLSGVFSANVDVSSANYVFPTGDYTICIGDGNLNDATDNYRGSLSFTGLKSATTEVITVASGAGEVLAVDVDLVFSGGEYFCLDNVYADGDFIKYFNASLLWTSTNPAAESIDLVAVIKYTAAPGGDCIQVGKLNYFGGEPERCSNYFDWPAEWTTDAVNGKTATALVDVSSAKYNWTAGAYTICFGDGSTESTYETFKGRVSFPDLKTIHGPSDDDDEALSDTDIIIIATAVPGGVIVVGLAAYFAVFKNSCGWFGKGSKHGFDGGNDITNPINA